nr:magnesium-translocating P-type ATPase [Raoultella sp. NCTC 9187]
MPPRKPKTASQKTLVNLNTTREGLQEAHASTRLERDGLNEVAHDKPPHALIQLLIAFNNPFIYVLGILASISFFTDYWLPTSHGEEGDLTTVIIIGTMVALSGLVRFWQEHRSAKSAEALKSDGTHHRHGRSSRTRRAKRDPA